MCNLDKLDEPIVPYDWTADQALAVVEFLEVLAEVVWSRYGFAIAQECHPRPDPLAETPQLRLPFPPLWEYGIELDKDDTSDDLDDIPW